jgi:hypothetical protein
MIDIMTSTTIERHHDGLTIITTVELPKSPTFPIPSPVRERMNTADAVSELYAT